MVGEHGMNLFYDSVEKRQLCCGVRKVQPLKHYLADLDAWVTGLRRDQNPTRTDTPKIQLDHTHGGIVKLNPIADWTRDQVLDYVRAQRPDQPPPCQGLSVGGLRACRPGSCRATNARDAGGGRPRQPSADPVGERKGSGLIEVGRSFSARRSRRWPRGRRVARARRDSLTRWRAFVYISRCEPTAAGTLHGEVWFGWLDGAVLITPRTTGRRAPSWPGAIARGSGWATTGA
jgi:hypothetical protein